MSFLESGNKYMSIRASSGRVKTNKNSWNFCRRIGTAGFENVFTISRYIRHCDVSEAETDGCPLDSY